jgi:hypothetical protein
LLDGLKMIGRVRPLLGHPQVSSIALEVWAETEQLKGRRDYVRDKHGEPEALPPTWLAAVTTASATRLPL